MTECVHSVFACVCPTTVRESTPPHPGNDENARGRRVYDCTDIHTILFSLLHYYYTTTILGTHYTHNTPECVQSVGTIPGGRGG